MVANVLEAEQVELEEHGFPVDVDAEQADDVAGEAQRAGRRFDRLDRRVGLDDHADLLGRVVGRCAVADPPLEVGDPRGWHGRAEPGHPAADVRGDEPLDERRLRGIGDDRPVVVQRERGRSHHGDGSRDEVVPYLPGPEVAVLGDVEPAHRLLEDRHRPWRTRWAGCPPESGRDRSGSTWNSVIQGGFDAVTVGEGPRG